jgi:hypothetical protein
MSTSAATPPPEPAPLTHDRPRLMPPTDRRREGDRSRPSRFWKAFRLRHAHPGCFDTWTLSHPNTQQMAPRVVAPLFLLPLLLATAACGWGFQTHWHPSSNNYDKPRPVGRLLHNVRRTPLVALHAGGRGLVWFTPGDLRLHDHPALVADTAEEEKTPLYVFDPTYLATQPPHALSLQLRAVRDLRASLQKAGADLVVRTGSAEAVLPAVVEVGGWRVCMCMLCV